LQDEVIFAVDLVFSGGSVGVTEDGGEATGELGVGVEGIRPQSFQQVLGCRYGLCHDVGKLYPGERQRERRNAERVGQREPRL